MKLLARICLWFYVVVFVLAGGAVLFGAQGAAQMVGITQLSLEDGGVVSLMNQLRYFGAIAIGFGATVAVLSKQILTEKRHATLFLIVLLLIPLSRTISLFMDGLPHYSLLLLMLAEYGLFALFVVHAKRFIFTNPEATPEALPEGSPKAVTKASANEEA